MSAVAIEKLEIRNFRNLEQVDAEFGPRFNVVAGENGQGKTNLLEAVYVVATSKGFRSAKISELVRIGAPHASVRATIREDGTSRHQSIGLKAGTRVARIDDKRPDSLAAYAVRTPVVVFHPGELTLSMGSSSERRRLMDRVALYLVATSAADLENYGLAVKARQRALELRGPGAADLVDWETLCVRHGMAVMQHRARAAELLGTAATLTFSKIGAPGLLLGVRYVPSAPTDEGAFLAMLRQYRAADTRRGSASIGPHRDELLLELDERPVRGFASQGQHRAVTLALKAAEMDVISEARGVRPILLLDDVSSELDRARSSALFAFLRQQQGQVFLTTTRPEIIDAGGEPGARIDFTIASGRLRDISRSGG